MTEAAPAVAATTPVVDPDERAAAGRTLPWSRRDRALGFGLVLVVFAAVVASMVTNGAILTRGNLQVTWQIDDLDHLTAHPVASTWYRHVQPPLYNLTIGAILRWSPFPPIGTIYVLYLAALLGIGLLLADLLMRWRVHPWVAGFLAAGALINPTLLFNLVWNSYEVPVAFLLVLAVWLLQRYLQRPTGAGLVAVATVLTAAALTRSLLHPVLIVAVVALAAHARRIPWRGVAVALAIPVLLVGGWMVKNQVLFGTATTSSWLGFNLQRGVTAPMTRDQVEAAVHDGTVTSLALEPPWMPLDRYARWTGRCTPSHRDRSLFATVGADAKINFNNECFLPLYAQSQDNAVALVRRYPGRYASTRARIVPTSFSIVALGTDGNRNSYFTDFKIPAKTWMDDVADVAFVPVDRSLDMSDWNVPFLGADRFHYRLSLSLVAAGLALLIRTAVAAVRLVRHRRRDGLIDEGELLWLTVGGTMILVVFVGDLIEFGENRRFRTIVDPFLVTFPAAGAYRFLAARWAEHRRPAAVPLVEPTVDAGP